MFRTQTARRTARGMAVGALVLTLSASSLGGSATAAPSADETQGCSVLAHERNDGRHRLHDAWKGFREQLRDLAREARELDREAHKSKSATETTTSLKLEVSAANEELSQIRADAHQDIQDLAELGQACKEPRTPVVEDPHITLASLTDRDEDDETVTLFVQFNEKVECTGECKSLFTYKANDDETAVSAEDFDLDEDGMGATVTFKVDEDVKVVGDEDELVFTAGSASLKDADAKTIANETEEPVELSLQTNDLVMKYRDVVDQAIKDMQAVVDDVTAAFNALNEAALTAETADDAKAKQANEKAKEARAKAKEARGKPEGRGRPEGAGQGNSRKPAG